MAPLLTEAARSENAKVRKLAMESLAAFPDAIAFPVLVPLLASAESDARWEAQFALTKRKWEGCAESKRAIPDLLPVLEDRDSSRVALALEVLGAIGDRTLVPRFLEVLEKRPACAGSAVYAIEKVDPDWKANCGDQVRNRLAAHLKTGADSSVINALERTNDAQLFVALFEMLFDTNAWGFPARTQVDALKRWMARAAEAQTLIPALLAKLSKANQLAWELFKQLGWQPAVTAAKAHPEQCIAGVVEASRQSWSLTEFQTKIVTALAAPENASLFRQAAWSSGGGKPFVEGLDQIDATWIEAESSALVEALCGTDVDRTRSAICIIDRSGKKPSNHELFVALIKAGMKDLLEDSFWHEAAFRSLDVMQPNWWHGEDARSYVPALIECRHSRAMKVLGRIGDRNAIPALIRRGVAEPNRNTERERTDALKAIDPTWETSAEARSVIPWVIERLPELEGSARENCWKLLAQIGDRTAITALIQWTPSHYQLAEILERIDARWWDSEEARAAVPHLQRYMTKEGGASPIFPVLQKVDKEAAISALIDVVSAGVYQAAEKLPQGWKSSEAARAAVPKLLARMEKGQYVSPNILTLLNDPVFIAPLLKQAETREKESIEALRYGYGWPGEDFLTLPPETIRAVLEGRFSEVGPEAHARFPWLESAVRLRKGIFLRARIAQRLTEAHRTDADAMLPEIVAGMIAMHNCSISTIGATISFLANRARITQPQLDLAGEALGYNSKRVQNRDIQATYEPDLASGNAAVRALCQIDTPFTRKALWYVTAKKDKSIQLAACIGSRTWTLDFSEQRRIAAEELRRRGVAPAEVADVSPHEAYRIK